jgi:DNA repair protein RecO (recombination protein O)
VPVEIATPAFVLRTRSYGESDRIVTLITRDRGKVSGIAKGARNSRRRFGGTLEPFVHIRAVFHERAASDLVFLLRCELLDALQGFRRDLDRFTAGSYVLDLTDRMVLGTESGREVYGLVAEALALLDRGAPPAPLLRAFEMHLLALSGWAPAFDRCRTCEVDVGPAGTMYLGADRAGLLCRGCVPPETPVRAVGAGVLRELARLASGPLAAATCETGAGAAGRLADAATVAERLLEAVTSGPVRSRAFLGLG